MQVWLQVATNTLHTTPHLQQPGICLARPKWALWGAVSTYATAIPRKTYLAFFPVNCAPWAFVLCLWWKLCLSVKTSCKQLLTFFRTDWPRSPAESPDRRRSATQTLHDQLFLYHSRHCATQTSFAADCLKSFASAKFQSLEQQTLIQHSAACEPPGKVLLSVTEQQINFNTPAIGSTAAMQPLWLRSCYLIATLYLLVPAAANIEQQKQNCGATGQKCCLSCPPEIKASGKHQRPEVS